MPRMLSCRPTAEYKEKENFDVFIEYTASPRLDGKTVIIADPMLATGASMELSYRALLTKGEPERIHVASVIAPQAAVDYIAAHFPADKTTLLGGCHRQRDQLPLLHSARSGRCRRSRLRHQE